MVVGGGEMVEGESVILMNPVPEKMDGKSLLVRQKRRNDGISLVIHSNF